MRRLATVPLGLDEANAFVSAHHRHHGPVVGYKFAIGAVRGDAIVGVAIVGRPVARMRDDGLTLEVKRLATDGTRNACSFLYGACARAAYALGYRRIGTYILASENGAEHHLGEPAYDRVYGSAIFEFSVPLVAKFRAQWPDAVVGGTGTGDSRTVEASHD